MSSKRASASPGCAPRSAHNRPLREGRVLRSLPLWARRSSQLSARATVLSGPRRRSAESGRRHRCAAPSKCRQRRGSVPEHSRGWRRLGCRGAGGRHHVVERQVPHTRSLAKREDDREGADLRGIGTGRGLCSSWVSVQRAAVTRGSTIRPCGRSTAMSLDPSNRLEFSGRVGGPGGQPQTCPDLVGMRARLGGCEAVGGGDGTGNPLPTGARSRTPGTAR
jgi:hypothetical protein